MRGGKLPNPRFQRFGRIHPRLVVFFHDIQAGSLSGDGARRVAANQDVVLNRRAVHLFEVKCRQVRTIILGYQIPAFERVDHDIVLQHHILGVGDLYRFRPVLQIRFPSRVKFDSGKPWPLM